MSYIHTYKHTYTHINIHMMGLILPVPAKSPILGIERRILHVRSLVFEELQEEVVRL